MTTLFVDRLTVMDFSYLHPQRGLLGESWLIDVALSGGLDDQGMVLDFAAVKREVKHHADSVYDHKLIVPLLYAHCAITADSDDELTVSFTTESGEIIVHRSPPSALCLLEAEQVTTQSVAEAMAETLRHELPTNVTALDLRLYPETTQDAYFHYSHGLKHHGGNCQRIAHGHRSRLLIFRDGERDPELEKEWTERWRDIYIANASDLAATQSIDGRPYHRYAYEAAQGAFELLIAADRCYHIDTDTTVENIARHIAETLHFRHRGHRFEVRAFEGVNKGAVEKV